MRLSSIACSTTLALLLSGASLSASDPATYAGLKPDEFMRNWLVLKPFPVSADKSGEPSQEIQKTAFAEDLLKSQDGEANARPRAGLKQTFGERELEWKSVKSGSDVIDLKAGSSPSDYAIAYAWAEIELPEKIKGVLGLGSDDAVKVWLNGKLVHDNWSDRPCAPDDDIVPVDFAAGKNQLLLKVQNIRGDWSFACRLLSRELQANKLISAVMTSDSETVRKLLEHGLDVNAQAKPGVTAFQAARLHGDTEMMRLLAGRGAVTNAPMPPPDKLVDALFTTAITNNGPGAAVLVAQNGKVLFKKGYGLADVAHGAGFAPDTKSRIGSITKQFTAAAILKLQEQGKLSVQDKLSKYFPDFPRGDEVTLRHLLTHTSGIRSYTDKPGFMDKVTSPTEPDALIKSFQNDPYDFDPGKKWHYDNSGYFLLGRIIEKVSGQSYADFLRKNFFEPLGMTNTGVHRADLALEHEALGYQFNAAGFTNALNWDMSWAGGAGALYSTLEDLFRWNEGVFGGKVLNDASLKAAWTPVKAEDNQDDNSGNGYGYGWFSSQTRGAQEISHGGGLNGFSSFIMRLPRENFTVAILANALPGAPGADPGQLAHLVTEIYLGQKLDPRPTRQVNPAVSPDAFDALVGRYDYGGAVMTVTKEGLHLYAQLAGQPRFEIFPKSGTEFFWKVVDAQVTFVKDSQGKVTKAVHHQGGQTINAPRLEDLKEAKVDAASYDAFVGKYDYGAGQAIMTVSREGDRLFAQLTGQPKFEIFPKSPTEFFWKVVDAQVQFVKNDAGKITKAIHHQGGRTFDAPRIE
ncbi:MAG TPA: serine hydrolase [Candidatus Acidoferrum sp.]|jgi:CubicO group peptidase (beta-lactamase class C family)|nr:serine hydrolase [Candidatus Acidoferrum sp.]